MVASDVLYRVHILFQKQISRTYQDFAVLENARIKFQDFPGFPGLIRTLMSFDYNSIKHVHGAT